MRIVLSLLAGLVICAAAAGFYYFRVAQSHTTVTATPHVEQTVDNPALSTQTEQKTDQTEQKIDVPTAMEQPVQPAPAPIPPTPLPPKIVKTERIAPLPDGADGMMAQHGNTPPAIAHIKTKKHKKRVAHSKKRPLKSTPGVPIR